ncbi:hypothetical protein NKH74_28130 [Mesorhizobium sp. M0933]|uniref:hypothetical protein n=1 Tax=Mesorhizobium sp. M0933 TaxID=2957030 RepID=UPI00333580CA
MDMILHWLANPITTLALGFVLAVGANLLTPRVSTLIWSKKRTFKNLFIKAAWINEAKYLGSSPYAQARINHLGFTMLKYGIFLTIFIVVLVIFTTNLPDKTNMSLYEKVFISIGFGLFFVFATVIQYAFFAQSELYRDANEYIFSTEEALEKITRQINMKGSLIGPEAASTLIRFARAEISAAHVKSAYPDFVSNISFHGPLERMSLFPAPEAVSVAATSTMHSEREGESCQ